MAAFKAEFLQHYYDSRGVPLRSLLIAYLPRLNRVGIVFRPVTNFITSLKLFSKIIGFSEKRSVPVLSKSTLRKWKKRHPGNNGKYPKGKIYLFSDEFTDYNESDIGIKAVMLLEKLGYEVSIPRHIESGRTFLSKGMLRQAKKIAVRNITLLKDLISEETPLVGIEPSAILAFRDEYPVMADNDLSQQALVLSRNSLLFEEFICREIDKGFIDPSFFTDNERKILLHGHCQQKAIASTSVTIRMLSLPVNYRVIEIPDGCCGMAGAFGYEKEHYDLSMKIGEMVLFPAVRGASSDTLIAASGTSCRHQIKDGTGRPAYHPVEILYDALK
jgi:Fe-S oxidoreductase